MTCGGDPRGKRIEKKGEGLFPGYVRGLRGVTRKSERVGKKARETERYQNVASWHTQKTNNKRREKRGQKANSRVGKIVRADDSFKREKGTMEGTRKGIQSKGGDSKPKVERKTEKKSRSKMPCFVARA